MARSPIPAVVDVDLTPALPATFARTNGSANVRLMLEPLARVHLEPPAVDSYQVSDGEDYPEIKQLGAWIAEVLTTYDAGQEPDFIAFASEDAVDDLAELARPLVHRGRWSRGATVYPQFGGFRDGHASVMVVVRQMVGSGSSVEFTETRTFDIRLVQQGSGWRFAELASIGGERLDRPSDLSSAANAVLDHPNIELPDSARWDIYRGEISDDLLDLMADMADFVPYGVVVLQSGHPHNVFRTDRVSNHTLGKSVDVYRVGSVTVADDRSRGSATWDLAAWLLGRSDVTRLGGPWSLDDRRTFTDLVHQDHLHISAAG